MAPERNTSSHNVERNTPIYALYNHRRVQTTSPAIFFQLRVLTAARQNQGDVIRRQPPRFKYRGSNGSNRLLQQADPRPPELNDFVARKEADRGETQPTDGIASTSRRVYGPETGTRGNSLERSLGIREISGQSAVYPVMRVRARSRDIPVSRAK